MGNIMKRWGIIAFLMMIAVVFTTCNDNDPKEPPLTGTVSIDGILQVGRILTVNTSALDGNGPLSFEWISSGGNVSYDNYYFTTENDIGCTITVTVFRQGYFGTASAKVSISGTPVVTDFNISNLSQTINNITPVLIIPKSYKSNGKITVYYNGSLTLPVSAGTYKVTFNIEAATGWNEATHLEAGNLIIYNQASIDIISYWVDYASNIYIDRKDGGKIYNNTIAILPGSIITFKPNNDDSYSHLKWTLNGNIAGNGKEYTFDTDGREVNKNYLIGLYVEKDGKPYYTQIILRISHALTGTVNITGIVQVGQTLTADTNGLGGNGIIFYQWKRDGYDITGANNGSYIVQDIDAGYSLSVTVSRSDYPGSITSEATDVVPRQPLTGTVSITGTAHEGQTLTANTDNLGGIGTISYQWKRGEIIVGTDKTYKVQMADANHGITVTVTRSGNTGSITSSTVWATSSRGSITVINTNPTTLRTDFIWLITANYSEYESVYNVLNGINSHTFTNVPAGSYRIMVTTANHNTYTSDSFTLTAGQTRTVIFNNQSFTIYN